MSEERIENLLPGVQGKDFHYVKIGGRVYAVYSIEINGKKIPIAWKVSESDYKAFGIDPEKIAQVSRQKFSTINVMGNASEIKRRGENVHPWTTYLRKLEDIYGNVPWLKNRGFMETMLEGWFEGWSDVELQQALKQTDWYQNRTDWQRKWVMDTSEAQRRATIDQVTNQLRNLVEAELGPEFDVKKLLSDRELDRLATNIASGKWGTPDDGIEIALSRLRRQAEKIEGTTAWLNRQQQIEAANAYENKPEEMFHQLTKDVQVWLGPNGAPSNDVLKRWAGNLATGKSSNADWLTYLERQAHALYPYLDKGETWQDRAASYKQIAEREWGRPVDWNDKVLTEIGARDANTMAFTGQALPYDEFLRLVRSKREWWQGPVAREEGFQLVNYLNNVFNGVS